MDIRQAVHEKRYVDIINYANDSFDEQAIHQLVLTLHDLVISDDIEEWRDHYVALQSAVSTTQVDRFKATQVRYLMKIKSLCLNKTMLWIIGDGIQAVAENRYDILSAIARGASKSVYIPYSSYQIAWIVLHSLVQKVRSADAINYVFAFLLGLNDADSELAREVYRYTAGEIQGDTDFAKVVPVGEVQYPGVSQLTIPDKDARHDANMANKVTASVDAYLLRLFYGSF